MNWIRKYPNRVYKKKNPGLGPNIGLIKVKISEQVWPGIELSTCSL